VTKKKGAGSPRVQLSLQPADSSERQSATAFTGKRIRATCHVKRQKKGTGRYQNGRQGKNVARRTRAKKRRAGTSGEGPG